MTTVAAPDPATSQGEIGSAEPHFVLSRPHGTVSGHGVADTTTDPDAAVALLRSGRARAVVGALPFDVREPAALTVPHRLDVTASPLPVSRRPAPLPAVAIRRRLPDPADHARRVADTVTLLRESSLRKVVLARAVELDADAPLDHRVILDRLVAADPTGNGFSVDLGAAGAAHRGVRLVGSSPEVLIRRRGNEVTCHPLAGSAPRDADPDTDRELGRTLANSAKDLTEHAYVIESLRAALDPLCTDVDAPARPILTSTPQLWHLGTPIHATLRDPAVTALELALAVHPTPAVCGTPTAEAMRTILAIEGSRGFYAGAVGWCDESGDGEWMVTIRCAQISADGLAVTAHAGGGIVAASDPSSELAETTTKFGTIMAALGVRR
ncbi:isochorismate synthase MenF [Rhodococcus sp. NPDC003318]|uniref:isochorismate synthase n=1 Tax=Rhodococcus sp. NPDC003318 TaxID=3364503 RepID=UPI0036BA0D1D